MFDNNDRQLVVNLDCQLVKIELAFMITKTLFIRYYSIKCDLSLDSLEDIISHYIISGTNNSLSQSNFEPTNLNHRAFLIEVES